MEQEVNISMNASTIINAFRGKEVNEVPKCSLVSDCSTPGPPRQRLTKEQLSPLIESYSIESKEKAFHPQLQEICLKNPIVIIRGLINVLELDLSLFSTKILVKKNPDLIIEIREQVKYAPDENWDKTQTKKVWECVSDTSYSTIGNYASYQTKENHLEDQENQESICGNVCTSNSLGTVTKYKKNQKVKFATNVDLSTVQLWKPQLEELAKLPPFLRVESTDNINMLSHVGYNLLGMNTVQLYMKVPGCKTTGHQENNNFCSVNINIGPGDCEWFAVPHEYWGVIHSLCEQNDVDYARGSWWPPDLDVLHKENVPVYRFRQKPGELVWVNVGCVHWVYAISMCNNIAWNVGPFTAKQYQLAMERYEWNKLYQYQSIVPMVHLSWRLAHHAKVSDPQLFKLIKNCLLQTMKQNYLTLEFMRQKGLEVIHDGDREIDRTFYCEDCIVEIFNIYICKKKKLEYVVYCIHCALKHSSSLKEFSCFIKYHMEHFENVYDNFKCQL